MGYLYLAYDVGVGKNDKIILLINKQFANSKSYSGRYNQNIDKKGIPEVSATNLNSRHENEPNMTKSSMVHVI